MVTVTEIELQVIQWVLGAIGALAVAVFGVWWKIESRQNDKIDTLAVSNEIDHDKLHQRISETKVDLKDEMTKQHLTLRDKIEELIREVRNGRH